MAPAQVSVLFVCLGNICRSTMAEGYFRDLTKFDSGSQHALIKEIDSCGTGAYHAGDSPDERTMAVLADHGITTYVHAARKVRIPEDLARFDYVLAMDKSNYRDLHDLAESARRHGKVGDVEVAKIQFLGAFGGKSKTEVIGDPYYGGKGGFLEVYEQVERCCKGLLRDIEEKAAKL